MLDAELNDGDLTQVTQAIQNALRPVGFGPAPGTRVATIPTPTNAEVQIEDQAAESSSDDELVGAPMSPKPKKRQGKKPRTPNVLDLDLDSEPAFVQFASAKNPSSDRMRFLTIAAWFKNARQVSAITADHIYTCYRKMDWPYGINFDQPLYDLKKARLLESSGNGEYAINHIGLDKVSKV